MIDKDNPPADKDNLSDVKMTSPADPKTVRFVSPLETDKPPSTTHSEYDDMLTKTKTAIMEDISLMMSDYDVTMSSVQIEKVVESLLPSSVTSRHSSTTHSKSTDNPENNPNITPPPHPPPLKSYEIYTTCTTSCTDNIMTDKYVATGPYESVSSSFGYPQTPTSPTNQSDLTPPTSTKSVRKIRQKRQKRSKRKARDQHTKYLEQQVEELKQQLHEKQKQKEKEKITLELYESLKRSKQLETEKLEQLDNLIKEKEQDREDGRH